MASLERRLRQAMEMTVGKKKRILLARLDLERTHGQLLEVGITPDNDSKLLLFVVTMPPGLSVETWKTVLL